MKIEEQIPSPLQGILFETRDTSFAFPSVSQWKQTKKQKKKAQAYIFAHCLVCMYCSKYWEPWSALTGGGSQMVGSEHCWSLPHSTRCCLRNTGFALAWPLSFFPSICLRITSPFVLLFISVFSLWTWINKRSHWRNHSASKKPKVN